MWHYVVIQIERSRQYNQAGDTVQEACWTILYKVPIEREDLGELSLCFIGVRSWIENNKAPGSKYAIVKMYLVP